TIAPAAAGVPLTFAEGGAIHVENVHVIAKDADKPGDPSIAAEALDNSAVELLHCELEAGNGANGSDAVKEAAPAPDGAPGTKGDDACMMGNGGDGGTTSCPGDPADGGRGGKGGPNAIDDGGSMGHAGQGTGGGAGGDGQPAMIGFCSPGKDGAAGIDGTPS